MKEAIRKLSAKQIDFICEECEITEDELNSMNEDILYDEVYEKMCEIEIEEVCDYGENERCEIASDIVTILGNALD